MKRRPKGAYEHEVAQAVAEFDITPGRILRQIPCVAFFDARKTAGKQLFELDDDTAAAIAGMEMQHLYRRVARGARHHRRDPHLEVGGQAQGSRYAGEASQPLRRRQRRQSAALAQALAAFIGSMHSQDGSKPPPITSGEA